MAAPMHNTMDPEVALRYAQDGILELDHRNVQLFAKKVSALMDLRVAQAAERAHEKGYLQGAKDERTRLRKYINACDGEQHEEER